MIYVKYFMYVHKLVRPSPYELVPNIFAIYIQ